MDAVAANNPNVRQEETTVYEIPKPQLLDADRVDRDDREDFTAKDHRAQAQLLAKALAESCAYADQLWDQVNSLRAYLLDSLPPDPRTPGPHLSAGASPTGPDDEHGWQQWINAFASTTSVLCGSHGDSGFGLSRAREEAQLRRTAPELLLHARHPHLESPHPAAEATVASTNRMTAKDERPSQARETADVAHVATAVMKAAAAAVIGVLALRGLRTPRRPSSDASSR